MAKDKRSEKGFPTDPVRALRARELLTQIRGLVAAENWREAAPLSAGLVRIAPDLSEGHELMGVVAMRTGAVPIAERCFERSVALGPVTASRLLLWGKALLAMGEAQAAENVLHRALLIRVDDATILVALGEAQLSQGNETNALRSFRRALKKSPDDNYARHMVAALDKTGTPDTTYVAKVFDDYADIFDEHLTGALNYRVPEALASLIQQQRFRAQTILDIGCGTGLVAKALQPLNAQIDGIDLSPRMIEKARERGLYRHLAVGEAAETLTVEPAFAGPYDLIAAADVFIYVGEIEQLFAAAIARLARQGIIAFSIETAEDKDIEIRPNGRFAHASGYIEKLAEQYNLDIIARADHDIRLEHKRPVKGMLFLLANR